MKKLTFLLIVFAAFISCKKEDKPSTKTPSTNPKVDYAGYGTMVRDYYNFNLGYWTTAYDTSYDWSFNIIKSFKDSATVTFSKFYPGDTVTVALRQSRFLRDTLNLRINQSPSQTAGYSYYFDLEIKGDSLIGDIVYNSFPPSERTYSLWFKKQ